MFWSINIFEAYSNKAHQKLQKSILWTTCFTPLLKLAYLLNNGWSFLQIEKGHWTFLKWQVESSIVWVGGCSSQPCKKKPFINKKLYKKWHPRETFLLHLKLCDVVIFTFVCLEGFYFNCDETHGCYHSTFWWLLCFVVLVTPWHLHLLPLKLCFPSTGCFAFHCDDGWPVTAVTINY